MQDCCKMYRDRAACAEDAGKSARLEVLADVLCTLMPLVGKVPGNEWQVAKLYAPHVAKLLGELQAAGRM